MPVSDQKTVEELNQASLENLAISLLADVLIGKSLGKAALVSSFGAESAVLLHLASRVMPEVPVIFIDTRMLFPETLEYQLKIADKFGLANVKRVSVPAGIIQVYDPDETMHDKDPDTCCHYRKVVPLEMALDGYDAWISGRKRFQSNSRSELKVFEADDQSGRIKLNPLAFWAPTDLKAYFDRYNLPRHPLVEKGYPSIGCQPCTAKVPEGEDPRSGRWRNSEKTECGIHITGRGIKSRLEKA